MFREAVKQESKLRLAVTGPSGAGKTYTALKVATHLANGGKIAVVDTEHGSASKYAGDLFRFDVVNFEAPFHPDRFVEAIHAAEERGYDVLILDSISHAWNGAGGLLEIVDNASKKYKGNTYAAWSEGTPIHNRFIEAMVGAKLHIIATMRSKTDYVLVERNGKQVPQKVGMAPIQRDNTEYEFDVVLDMDIENNAIVSKTRCPALTGAVIPKPGDDLAETLRQWLSGEKPPTPEELREIALEAETAADWTYAAYRLPMVDGHFESEKRLGDWLGFVADSYEEEHADLYLDVLDAYVSMVADEVKVKEAANKAREMVLAVTANGTGQEQE